MDKARIEDGVSCIVPTFRRPEGLKLALESLTRQNADGLAMEIIVADNDPAGSAREFVTDFAKSAPVPVHYIHVPEPGVSNARNAALARARGRYLAFLDDDQEAGEGWLETLLDITDRYGAALAFVPTIARIPGQSKYDSYLKDFFSRMGPDLDQGVIPEYYGCGNSLLDTHRCTLPCPPFNTAMNETGGEDDVLFSQLQSQGICIAWSKQACAYEDIRPHRATPDYIKVRSFAFGQSPSQECADKSPRDYAGIVKWMLIGAAQYSVYTPLKWLTRLIGHPSYIRYLAKASEGRGKIFWWDSFKPRLYGAAVVENKAF